MEKVRVGIIGVGNMGNTHATHLFNGRIKGAELVAVCDKDSERIDWAKGEFGDKVKIFSDSKDFFEFKEMDAVVVATPHYFHPELAIKAFENNFHVLVEKPAGVYAKQVREMNEAALKSDKVFGLMLNQRTNPLYQKVKDLVDSGELGEIKRTNWIVTSWYRSQSYYNSGGWRATWEGEGGGVLLNQSPHQLDLWQWICGMPVKVRAFMGFGKWHNIEVEDDVTAYVEYENGATGVFITSTGDAPGTNRFEILGDKGKAVIEENQLKFWRLRIPERQYNAEYTGGFGHPESWKCEIPIEGKTTGHAGIFENWIEAIQKNTPLIAPGLEGINGVTLSNAMHLSAFTDDWVDVKNMDENLYYEKLQEKIKNSTFKKPEGSTKTLSVKGTF